MLDAIFERRSIRKYKTVPVEKDKLEQVLKAAMYAPSARNKQPWHFIVFDNKESVKQVKELHPYSISLETAPAAILVCGDTELETAPGFYLSDCGASVQNILIAAKELGLDTCWMGIFPHKELEEKFAGCFDLPENVKPYALIALGYGDQTPPMPERYDKNRIHFNKW